ncbi:MAG: hypothetical protein OXF73_06455 [Gammaproteobacteria bacterium]|nr:hypothetical protein [Gammaproteobacteria bacterium]MCY4227886.1 hypothetical protein [Gammaproteobacteria bacterium]
MQDQEHSIERNTEFQASRIRVFIQNDEDRELSVNSTEDLVVSESEESPIPDHIARRWHLSKVDSDGTSIVIALVSWDENNPTDYLMAGWWAQFNGQQPPNLTYSSLDEYAIVDGPEFDTQITPELTMPTEGTASYIGPAGGIYWYVPGETSEEGYAKVDGWEARIEMEANFDSGTLGGRIDSFRDFEALVAASYGEVQFDIKDYEIRLIQARYDEKGIIEDGIVEILHPSTHPVASPESSWQAFFSNLPDRENNPRLLGGFAEASFTEEDGSEGGFFGNFVGLSEGFRMPE